MTDLDDGMLLNITPYQRKEKPPPERKVRNNDESIIKSSQNISRSKNEQEKNIVGKKHTKKQHRGKYIDPKDFVPVSSLFNKNPDIPSHESKSNDPIKESVTFAAEFIDDLSSVETRIKENLKQQFKFKTLTKIQQLAIPKVLDGHDVMIKSFTGSGKTMCYAVPILDKISKMVPAVSRCDGTFALVLVPTRELASQTFDVLQLLCKSFINIVPGLLIGGEKCKSEKARLRKGVNIIIATPGRFEYHLKETQCLDVSKLSFLVLDEADKLLDLGYEKTINDILKELNIRVQLAERQTILLSATLSNHIHNLAAVSLKDPVFVDPMATATTPADQQKEHTDQYVIPSSLDQYYMTAPAKLRLVSLLLFAYSKVISKKGKMIVFVSNKNSVVFLHGVMKQLLVQFYECDEKTAKTVFMLHGDMNQADRAKTFEMFKKLSSAILFTTDVAARGLDIPKVNWIIQYSCPTQIEDYLHRVGRTARIGEKGKSLLFLLPSEIEYLSELENLSLILKEKKLNDVLKESITNEKKSKQKGKYSVEEHATRIQQFIEEEIILKSKLSHELSTSAFNSYIKSYATYPASVKKIFHVRHLHLGHLAKSFGLREAPTKLTNVKFITNSNNNNNNRKKKEDVMKKRGDMKRKTMLSGDNEIFSGPRTKKFKPVTKKTKKKIRI